ncbi:MAG: DNA-binding response regulator [Proteobacteria bacterium]|nr:MAG: DNA-binding response regulator [Pseudomonadota bacterium]
MASLSSPSAPRRRGLIVEDQADTRDWLVRMLGIAFEGIAISEAPTRRAAFDWIRSQPRMVTGDATPRDIALIDLGLPDGSGIDLIRLLANDYPHVLPVVTTIYDDDEHLFDAIAAGAKGYLLKDQHADTFVSYLHRIEVGEPPLSPSIAQRMLLHFSRPRGEADLTENVALTARELDVLRLLGRGLRVAEAARVLGLTPHTVTGYVKAVYRKLNISSRAEAAVEAVRRGLV